MGYDGLLNPSFYESLRRLTHPTLMLIATKAIALIFACKKLLQTVS
ncbi:MAG: hypothetical protein AAGE84_27675 [Cyanobacteria bacterium P01_G01_bin.39]